MHAHILAKLFCVCLIATYAFGFNLLCSYNLQSSFAVYPFYDVRITPVLAGTALAAITAVCLMGGGERIVKITGFIVPFMGVSYVAISLIVILLNVACFCS